VIVSVARRIGDARTDDEPLSSFANQDDLRRRQVAGGPPNLVTCQSRPTSDHDLARIAPQCVNDVA
jgi:hypothetical protein